MDVRTIELKKTILEDNDRDADLLRRQLKDEGTYYINVMSSPGSGKTRTLIRTIRTLQQMEREHQAEHLRIGTVQYAMQTYIRPLIEDGRVKMTIPERPRSQSQKYYAAK